MLNGMRLKKIKILLKVMETTNKLFSWSPFELITNHFSITTGRSKVNQICFATIEKINKTSFEGFEHQRDGTRKPIMFVIRLKEGSAWRAAIPNEIIGREGDLCRATGPSNEGKQLDGMERGKKFVRNDQKKILVTFPRFASTCSEMFACLLLDDDTIRNGNKTESRNWPPTTFVQFSFSFVCLLFDLRWLTRQEKNSSNRKLRINSKPTDEKKKKETIWTLQGQRSAGIV